MSKILLIGGSNIDYIGTSDEPLIPNVSNIGKINISFGGVMRNTAEDLSRIGHPSIFITAIGNDQNGSLLKTNIEDLNIELYTPETQYPSSSFLAINNNDHDLALAICDGRILEDLNPNFLKKYTNLLSKQEFIAIDSNLFEETINYLLNTYPKVKFIAEGISPAKIMRYKKNLDKIYLLKCNIHQAKKLVGMDIEGKELIQKMFDINVCNVVVTNGAKDVFYGIDKKEIGFVKINEIKDVINTTGCGDAMFAGIIDKVTQGKTLKEAIEFGIELSNITLMTNKACSEDLAKFAYKH